MCVLLRRESDNPDRYWGIKYSRKVLSRWGLLLKRPCFLKRNCKIILFISKIRNVIGYQILMKVLSRWDLLYKRPCFHKRNCKLILFKKNTMYVFSLSPFTLLWYLYQIVTFPCYCHLNDCSSVTLF